VTSGPTYVAAREVRVDLDFFDGKSGKGVLSVLFQPSTGLYLHALAWEPDGYPKYDFVGHLEEGCRVGVDRDRLFIAAFANGVVVNHSIEKATSIDDAEAKSLKWYADHLPQVEDRSYRGQTTNTVLALDRFESPKGFFQSEIDSRPGLPVKLVDMAWNGDDAWVLTLENTEGSTAHPRANLVIFRSGGAWSRGRVIAADPEKPR
jgi:hypothetical protein